MTRSNTDWRQVFAVATQRYAAHASETARDALAHDCFDAAWWQLVAAREYASARNWYDRSDR